jgi:hypothetical protein
LQAHLAAVGQGPIAKDRHVAYCSHESDGEHLAIKNKRNIMHLLFAPLLASAVYIGSGVGLVLLIVIIVLILR